MPFNYQSDGHIKRQKHSDFLRYTMEYGQVIFMLVLHECILQTLAREQTSRQCELNDLRFMIL